MTPVAVEMNLLVSRDERPIDQPAGPPPGPGDESRLNYARIEKVSNRTNADGNAVGQEQHSRFAFSGNLG